MRFIVIDEEGFRPNVGIILANQHNELLWAQRVGQDAWQFPQGGINPSESLEQAMYRELYEEVGLERSDVQWLGCTKSWLKYRLPKRLVRVESKPVCIGQKQKWVLIRLLSDDKRIDFKKTQKPEFESLRWVSYWFPLRQVVSFKRDVYRRALMELAPILFEESGIAKSYCDPLDE